MASCAKKMRANFEHGMQPQSKIGRKLPFPIIEKVKNFYLSDDTSRVMPRIKEYESTRDDCEQINTEKNS